MYNRWINNDELYHYGVKGMKWGVRKNQQVVAAKRNYKQADKMYRKAYNKWYFGSFTSPGFTAKQRRTNEKRFATAMVAAGTRGIAKGKYMEAQGKAKGNQKKIAKGKMIAERAANARAYNIKVSKLMSEGYTTREATNKLQPEYKKSREREQEIYRRYRKATDK